jgi:adenine-specific DNA methylase
MRKKIGQLERYYTVYRPKDVEPPRTLLASATALERIASASVDYVFTDPPFGSNIFYADCNIIWESWLGRTTDPRQEAVVNRSLTAREGGKSLADYALLMEQSMKEIARVLKPGGWATVVFHNTDADVWAALRSAAVAAGFEFHEAANLDRKQQSHKGYKGRQGAEDVAHFDVVMNLRKIESAAKQTPTAQMELDLVALVDEALAQPEVFARGVQGVHAEVMRTLVSIGSEYFPDFADVRQAFERRLAAA